MSARARGRLFDPGPRRRGRTRTYLDTQIRALRKADRFDEAEHAGLLGLARDIADALDLARSTEQPYAIAHLSRPFLETIARLTGRASGDDDELARLFADLSAPLRDEAPGPSDLG